MKYIHTIKISVFSKQEDDEEKIKQTLTSIIPFDLVKEKIELTTTITKGLYDNDINIFEIKLSKQRHTDDLFNYLITKLGEKQKKLLIEQKESRLDDKIDFFIRLDKTALINNEFILTDSGNCFHIRISIAAYPAKKEVALKILSIILTQNNH